MGESTQRRNFLIAQGRLLANGQRDHLTPEEWLYLASEVEDDLIGPQKAIFASFGENLRQQIVVRALDMVAL